MNKNVILEKSAYKITMQNLEHPLIFELPVEQGRKILEDLQSKPICMYPTQVKINYIDTLKHGIIKVYTVIPQCFNNIRNIIFYIHGAGWVFGSFNTHEKLVKELAYRTNSVVIFPEYTRSPEAKFPVAIEECYLILKQIPKILKCNNINENFRTLTVAGDSVGGNMAIAISLISKFENGPNINKLLLYYPVTNDDFNTKSYIKFANGYYLYRDGMKWFWDQYMPDKEKRNTILATPLKASIEQLQDLPSTMILNGEADVLRDEGEEFANKLRAAGNNVTAVRFQGMIHDFVMLNDLDCSNACRAAMDLSTSWINDKMI